MAIFPITTPPRVGEQIDFEFLSIVSIVVKMRQEDSMIVCLKDDGVVRINEQHRLLIDISP